MHGMQPAMPADREFEKTYWNLDAENFCSASAMECTVSLVTPGPGLHTCFKCLISTLVHVQAYHGDADADLAGRDGKGHGFFKIRQKEIVGTALPLGRDHPVHFLPGRLTQYWLYIILR